MRILLFLSSVAALLAIVPAACGAPKSREKTPIPDFTQGGKIPAGTLEVTQKVSPPIGSPFQGSMIPMRSGSQGFALGCLGLPLRGGDPKIVDWGFCGPL
ncbi:MAG: hypothetical protein WCS43_16740 [Verrucomicrobiota bacterium]